MRRRCLVSLPVLALLLALVVSSAPVRAQSSAATDPHQQPTPLILQANEEDVVALKDLQDLRARKAMIDARVAELDGQLRDLQAKLTPLRAKVARLAAAYDETQVRLIAKQAELDIAKAEFDASAADMYRAARNGATY